MLPARRTPVQVYDPVLRVLHGVNALLIVLLALSGLVAQSIPVGALSGWLHATHGVLGLSLVAGLLARLVWGFAGPQSARWQDMWHPAAWRAALLARRVFVSPHRRGHHPHASLVYLLVYALLAGLAASGLALLASTQGQGPLSPWLGFDAWLTTQLIDPHRIAGWLLTGFIGIHLAALWLHARVHRIPVAQGMINGMQYLETK